MIKLINNLSSSREIRINKLSSLEGLTSEKERTAFIILCLSCISKIPSFFDDDPARLNTEQRLIKVVNDALLCAIPSFFIEKGDSADHFYKMKIEVGLRPICKKDNFTMYRKIKKSLYSDLTIKDIYVAPVVDSTQFALRIFSNNEINHISDVCLFDNELRLENYDTKEYKTIIMKLIIENFKRQFAVSVGIYEKPIESTEKKAKVRKEFVSLKRKLRKDFESWAGESVESLIKSAPNAAIATVIMDDLLEYFAQLDQYKAQSMLIDKHTLYFENSIFNVITHDHGTEFDLGFDSQLQKSSHNQNRTHKTEIQTGFDNHNFD